MTGVLPQRRWSRHGKVAAYDTTHQSSQYRYVRVHMSPSTFLLYYLARFPESRIVSRRPILVSKTRTGFVSEREVIKGFHTCDCPATYIVYMNVRFWLLSTR